MHFVSPRCMIDPHYKITVATSLQVINAQLNYTLLNTCSIFDNKKHTVECIILY